MKLSDKAWLMKRGASRKVLEAIDFLEIETIEEFSKEPIHYFDAFEGVTDWTLSLIVKLQYIASKRVEQLKGKQ